MGVGVGVGVFWDLSSKPPTTTLPLRDVAVRLHLAASSFGPLRLSLAFASPRSLLPSPSPSPSPSPASSPSPCRVCGRNFFVGAKLLRHFAEIHAPEHAKRLRRLASARGARRVRLAAALAPKLARFEKAARDLRAAPRGPADELRRAGVTVRAVEGAPRRAIRDRAVGAMDEGILACVVLVSDDSGLAEVLGEARRRRLRTVVVGFRWAEVVSGKARAAAPAMVGRWRDREMLKRLEWSFNEDEDEDEDEIESEGFEWDSEEEEEEEEEGGRENGRAPWWELD
ncbi:major centromere autoantigen B-like [Ananas comosus]|uniref:Major centromere autoantigen B-like n=1 Tax=Ananas comosus TaxID=4615 RepID=A0A6P5GRK2_ANACO|nr:major centromere autoantigen B-like [Ananas comosus]